MTNQGTIAWLRERHDEIMAKEADALKALEQGNISSYNALMRDKAMLLANLAADYNKFASGLPDKKILDKLEQFSGSASTALELDSVFYMSALLYRDDHKKGEPDNLEVFIQGL